MMDFLANSFNRNGLLIGNVVTLLLLAYFGFFLPEVASQFIFYFFTLIAGSYCVLEITNLGRQPYGRRWTYARERRFELSVAAIIFVYVFLYRDVAQTMRMFAPGATLQSINLGLLGALILLGFFKLMIQRLQGILSGAQIPLRPAQLFLLSFMIPALAGMLLLKLPRATYAGILWVDALFTAVSALCVTGLSSVDTPGTFTPLGLIIICLLIQLGGLGIMTLTITFASFLAGGMGIRERILMSDFLSEERVGAIRGLLARICIFTFSIEACGALYLYYSAGGRLESFQGPLLLSSIFHAVSAFCNAGFSLYSQSFYDPAFRANFSYASGIMVLIVLGGVGFPVLSNLADMVGNLFKKQKRYRLMTTSTKLVLTATVALLFLGTLMFWFLESRASYAELSRFEQFFQSLFFAVTARTAGFNLWPVESLSIASLLLLMFLMWIGGAPMSTAGGVKVTTVMVGLLNIRSQMRGTERLETFGREIRQGSINRAYAAMAISVAAISIASVIIVFFERHLQPIDCLFETVSAWATVGLSRGITAGLSPASKVVLCLTMFAGRVGLITVLAAFVRPPQSENYKLLEDSVIIY